jgi:hypothetical protein
MLGNRKAQAVLELAILGSLIIWAFSILISYSERYNREQSYMQQTFRAALKNAKGINDSVAWNTMDFRRMPNVVNPMEIGQLQQFSASSNVLWSDGKKDPDIGESSKAKSYYQFNRGTPVDITGSDTGDGPQENTVTSSGSSYVSNLDSTTDYEKNESFGGSINTRKSLKAQDTIGAAVSGDQPAFATAVLSGDSKHGGTYTSKGSGLIRQTENVKDVQ